MAAKRKIICPQCKAHLALDPQKITAPVVKFKCPCCSLILRFRKHDPQKKKSILPPPSRTESIGTIFNGDPGGELLDLANKLEMEMEFMFDESHGEAEKIELEAGSGISGDSGQEVLVERRPGSEEIEGPLIPADKLISPETYRRKLLEDYAHDRLSIYEEGEAEDGDTEWTRFADKKGIKSAQSKIDLNELPTGATGLKETLANLSRAETLNLQGETHVRRNHYAEALQDFSKAIEINPDYAAALTNRGSVYVKLGRYNDALMDFNHALKFEKKDAVLYTKRGEIFMLHHMHEQAIKDFTAAIILNPMFRDAYLNRGCVYSDKGMPEEARQDVNQAIKVISEYSFNFIDPAAPGIASDETSEATIAEAAEFNQQGLADLDNKKYLEAVQSFSRTINLVPGKAEYYFNRGRAYMGLDKPDKALADFNQAILFDPLNAYLYFWRAQAWKAKDSPQNMIDDLKLSCEMGYEPACREYTKAKSLNQ